MLLYDGTKGLRRPRRSRGSIIAEQSVRDADDELNDVRVYNRRSERTGNQAVCMARRNHAAWRSGGPSSNGADAGGQPPACWSGRELGFLPAMTQPGPRQDC